MTKNIDNKVVNNLRVMGCQMVEHANSGHPGIVLGATPVLYTLYAKFLNTSNEQPNHFLRDRFVLSAGHGSAMLYSVLHSLGFGLTKNDLKTFRQVESVCAGHPELDASLGIESTTGPLGQGVANAVGMAIAEQHLASRFNKKDCKIINNHTYALVGDGCLMEGVANEALSLAGTLRLNKLIVFYDYNKITIDGRIDETFRQDTKQVFKGYGFNVLEVKNGNSLVEIERSIKKAQRSSKPTLIMVNSIIGFGSVLADTEKAHGAPLGAENMKKLHETLNIHTEFLELLPDVQVRLNEIKERYKTVLNNFNEKIDYYRKKYSKDYELLQEFLSLDFSSANNFLDKLKTNGKGLATRDYGGFVLAELSEKFKNIVGGSADLVSSTKTVVKNSGKFTDKNRAGRNIMFGVREFAMSAITNGIALYGGLVPFNSTFFAFSDYMKPGIRLASVMNLKNLYIFTHDSIGVGEDGPTHQSIEQLPTFRAMPNTTVFRPSGFNEVKAAFNVALNGKNTTLIILTRQKLEEVNDNYKKSLKGGYVISKEKGELSGVFVATGSEVQYCIKAQQLLEKQGVFTRVVSMPSQEIFNNQTTKYKNSVIPNAFKNIVSVEAGSTFGWERYVGMNGASIGVDEFGKSGKYNEIYAHFGITPENIAKTMKNVIKQNKN